MAITTRQTSMLVSSDWTRLYQTFRSADFQSYDFETLRKSMVDYLRLNYPEDFNDYIESSEFIALVDLIAFLGQSIAFRSDLNARENFIDTAQRRDSILKLARLISYVPKRNIPASGFLKIDSVSTTEQVLDSNGLNLAGLVVSWADTANDNWQEQFTAIFNASLRANQVIGKPSNSQYINGIQTDEYQVNLVPGVTATYTFSASIGGASTNFEMISATSTGKTYIYESAPQPGQPFNILYKNDNLGNHSVNTGFFTYFKQGSLTSQDIGFTDRIPNRVFSINVNNINNTDVWLYSLDINGNPATLWSQITSVGATNVIYNKSTNKNVYQVSSRADDQIDLIFGDGAFSNIPTGNFRVYYRVSNGANYKITPKEMQGITMSIGYTGRSGKIETLAIRGSLQYTVANSTSRESLDDVKQRAPQQYYTQDRMVTGEDYNILPYTLFSNIIKAKAVNRTSSGVSRYLDVIDTTGSYSSTNIFAEDGILYREETTNTFSFEYATATDIYRVITNQVTPLTSRIETKHFFYEKYPKIAPIDTIWHQSTTIANGSTGYLVNSNGKFLQVGNSVESTNKYITQGSIIQFSAGAGNYFDARNRIVAGTPTNPGDKLYIYAALVKLVGDGTNGGLGNLSNNTGPITLNQFVPTSAVAVSVYSVLNTTISSDLASVMTSYILAYESFALRYNQELAVWQLIKPQDVSNAEFSLSMAGNTAGQGLDASWIIKFQPVGKVYNVSYRGIRYVFESVSETDFYFDNTVKIYDNENGFTVRDQIKVLKINSEADNASPLDIDYTWYVYNNITEVDGYENPNRILVTFPDSNNDGIPDNPSLFDIIVSPSTNTNSKFVYFKTVNTSDSFATLEPVSNLLVISTYSRLIDIRNSATLYSSGQLFYVPSTNKFYQLTVTDLVYTVNEISGYTAKTGRQDIYFQYKHNAPGYRRIDPSPSNIIDLYILTQQYAIDYASWVRDSTNTVSKPIPLSGEELSVQFNTLENYKSISDTIIYNPAVFKPLFGAKAPLSLQAIFKVVKNSNVVVSDSDIKASVIAAINSYFDTSNWDFGETFYFSELASYLHTVLAPNVASIMIVPTDAASPFGSLMQINASYNEIVISAATVDNVQIISAITTASINQ